MRISDWSSDVCSSDLIETHGTGTRLGDPIEFNALKQIYAAREKKTPLYLGAVKSNIGHLEAMAGIASIMKVVLSLQHQTIPKNQIGRASCRERVCQYV